MSENKLTDNVYWKDFWESKKDLIFKVQSNYTFNRQLSRLIKDRSIKTVMLSPRSRIQQYGAL